MYDAALMLPSVLDGINAHNREMIKDVTHGLLPRHSLSAQVMHPMTNRFNDPALYEMGTKISFSH